MLRGGPNAGSPHFDYMIESTHAQSIYYFASMNGCSNGQKVAVNVVGSYAGNSAQCRGMGVGSSQIRHCDCDHHLRPTTLIDPCLTGFAEGCLSDMPTDTSCCPGSDASYDPVTRSYINGGSCISQSARARLSSTATELITLNATNTTAIAELDAITTCPSSRWSGCQDLLCCMLKEIRRCEVTPTPADCATSDEWVVFMETPAWQPACNVDDHHPENGGYYIEGIAGVNNSDRSGPNGRRGDVSIWEQGRYYPHGELRLCTGMFCTPESRVTGTPQYVVAHTCARLRFSYSASSGSTVYQFYNSNDFAVSLPLNAIACA